MTACLALAIASALHGSTIIDHVSIIDPATGTIKTNMRIEVEGDRIKSVKPSSMAPAPSGAKTVDASGKFAIPGLWDMHVHWYDEGRLKLFTANGVTGARVMFGQPMHLDWKKRTASGSLVGPRLVVGSPIVDGHKPMWQGSISFKEGDDARVLVSRLKNEGWDFIKVYSFLSRGSYLSIAKEANRQGVPFAGHVPHSVDPREAARLGQRSIEHFTEIKEIVSKRGDDILGAMQREFATDKSPTDALNAAYDSLGEGFMSPYDEERATRIFAEIGKSDIWMCPTLTVLRSLSRLDDAEFTNDSRMKYVTQQTRDMWNPANDFRLKERTKEDWDFARRDYSRKFGFVMSLKRAGARFLAGTDCLNPYCFPGFSLHDELELFVKAGFTPMEALQTATSNPALFFQDDTFGSVSKGKRADLVILDRNPLLDINNTRAIFAVVQGGRVYDRLALDQMLKDCEAP